MSNQEKSEFKKKYNLHLSLKKRRGTDE